MTLAEWCAVAAVLVGASAQAVTGIGFSLLCAPLLTLTLGGGDGVRLANVLAIGVNVLLLSREWRATDLRSVLPLLVPAAVAAPLTAWALDGTDPRVASAGVGVLVLASVVVLASGVRLPAMAGRRGAVAAGAVSGAMNVTAGVGGPAVASYVVNAGWAPERLRPTLAAYFLA